MCRSRRELSNEYLLAKFGFDPAENEPFQVSPLSAYRSLRFRHQLADKLVSKTRPEDPVLKGWYEKLERPSTNPQQGDFSRPSTNPQQNDFRSAFKDGLSENVSLGERVSLDDPSDLPEASPSSDKTTLPSPA